MASGSPRNFARCGRGVAFNAIVGGRDVVATSDGTPSGTRIVGEAIRATFGGNLEYPPIVFGDHVVFPHEDLAAGQRQIVSVGPAGDRTVLAAWPLYSNDHIMSLVQDGDLAYFSRNRPWVSAGTWRTDGTPDGTFEILPDWTIGQLHRLGDVSLFSAWHAALGSGCGFFQTDGTPAGTLELFVTGTHPSIIECPFAVSGTTAYYQNGSALGTELWSYSPESGPGPTIDINPGVASGAPQSITAVGSGAVVFRGINNQTGIELYRSDGSASGTYLVRDFLPGRDSGSPSILGSDGRLAYLQRSATGDNTVVEYWRTDGTADGTQRLLSVPHEVGPPGQGALSLLHHGKLIFSVRGAGGAYAVSVADTDGSQPQPIAVPALTQVAIATPLGNANRVFFSAVDATHGTELWVIDLCIADFNNDGQVTVGDLFEFLPAYLARSEPADVNGMGGVSPQDLFDFLQAFLAGCR